MSDAQRIDISKIHPNSSFLSQTSAWRSRFRDRDIPNPIRGNHDWYDWRACIQRIRLLVYDLEGDRKNRKARCWAEELAEEKFHARHRNTIKHLVRAFSETTEAETLEHILLYFNQTRVLNNVHILQSLPYISNYYKDRLRDIETLTLKLKTQNSRTQFSILLRHLFCDFYVPRFMDSVWCSDSSGYQSWFLHIGRGASLCTAPNSPVQLTKKVAHHFLLAPDSYSVPEAIRWGMLHAHGGNRWLANALRGSRFMLLDHFADTSFWISLARFLINHPHFNPRQQRRIVDYIYDVKYEPQRLLTPNGTRMLPPTQPHLTMKVMKGRRLQALLSAAEAWDPEVDLVSGFQWDRSQQIRPFTLQQQHPDGQVIWSVNELTSSEALVQEGKDLQHCVGADYDAHCFYGESSIWSLTRKTRQKTEKLLTIHVELPAHRITEIRGFENRVPTKSEFSIVKRWAKASGLNIDLHA